MNLYRRRVFPASLALLLVCTLLITLASAQRRKAHKLRSTGLLELTTDAAGNVKAQLIPITILDQGRFEDASIYKATPRPMAVETGVVYEAQKSGVPVGYVTLGTASKLGMWIGLGRWQQISTVAKKSEAPAAPRNPDDDRPRLHRGDSNNSSPASDSNPAPVAQTAPPSQPAPEPEPAEDSDRPVLRRRTPAANASQPQATPAPAPSRTAPPPPDAVPSTPPSVSSPGTKTYVAVSDNQPIDTRSFEFVWKAGEEEAMDARMRKLALAQLPRENAQLNDGSLKNVVIRSFDLDLSNEAVMVLTAEVPGSYMAPGTRTAPGKFVSRYITLIARVDFEGTPQRLAVSVTDSSRLDIAPRLELIDAVDADGDGLAELLFRQYSFDQKGFIVYGIGRSTVTKVFEGATEPLQ